jgi:hypothetical protein
VVLCFLRGSGAFIITLLIGHFREFFKDTAVFREIRSCGMPCKGLEWSEVGFIYLFELALCITLHLSKPGWAVEIEVDIQVTPVEVIGASGIALGSVHMPHVFSNNRPIFPFNQCIVIALARARLGLLNTERVQQLGNYMIDELRTVIGMKAENREGGFMPDAPKRYIPENRALELAEG